MRTTLDRVRQAVSFELIGLLLATPLASLAFGFHAAEIGPLAVAGATTATAWNYFYNLGFDHILRRVYGRTEKTVPIRIVHAVCFEATLLLLLLPLFAWWLQITLIEALIMDLSFAGFYMVYAFAFTWAYDSLFPPEPRARPATGGH